MKPPRPDLTQALQDLSRGNGEAFETILPAVYEELRSLASRYLDRERPDHTLQATALVHEAYLNLVDQTQVHWRNRAHFLGVAATAMRRILVNHAVRRRTVKKGGDRQRIDLDDAVAYFEERALDLLALDEALLRLSEIDSRQARIVEMHFFGGLTNREIGEIFNVSIRTVEREWRMARAWLRKQIGDPGGQQE